VRTRPVGPGVGSGDGGEAPDPARRRRLFGLRTRIAFFFATILVVVNVIVLLTQKRPIVLALEREFDMRGRELAINLAARARGGEPRRDLVEKFLEFEDVREASILARDGTVRAGSQAIIPEPGFRPESGDVVVRRNDHAADFFAAIAGGDAVAHVQLDARPLGSVVSGIGWTIAGIAALAVGAGFLLVFLAASAFTRPVLQLADQARRIRGGDLGIRLQLRRDDEIGELSAAMDAMSVGLAETTRRLRVAKDSGERQNRRLREKSRALAAQTRNLETLVASIPERVVFLGLDGRVAIANRSAEELLAPAAGRLVGLSLGELRFAEADAPLRRLLEDASACAARNARNLAQICFADQLHTVMTVHDPDGSAVGVLAVVQDLSKIRALETEQKELLEQLYQQEKMAIVGLLAASLAHELNTPLGTILLHAQQVARELDSEKARALETIELEVRRCRDIVRRLLDFSRLAESRPGILDLTLPLQRSVSITEPSLRAKRITLSDCVGADVPLVLADADQMEQVLVNLIWNAADAIPAEGGHIEMRLRRAGPGAELMVLDDGKGIPREHRDKIFEPFFTTKPKGRGTGLGLAICRRIVEEQRGTIAVEARPGGGTRVRIRLPAVENGDG